MSVGCKPIQLAAQEKANLLLDTGFEVQPRDKTPTRCTKTMKNQDFCNVALECSRFMYLKNMSEEI